MPFLETLRRKSMASFRGDRQQSRMERPGTRGSNGLSNDLAASKSSTTVNTPNTSVGSTTPPLISPIPDQRNGQARRPNVASASSSRYSMAGMTGIGSPNLSSASPYAPRIHNIKDGGCVFQKFALVSGMIGDHSQDGFAKLDGTLTVSRVDEQFPPVSFPVYESYFKVLVFFLPGQNRLRLDFTSPKLPNGHSSNPINTTYITLNMVPLTSSPPLQLVILQGKDSPGTFDAPPARIEKEGNGIETAIKKYRMAAYLWQAFTSEQMERGNMGRRVFRLEEEWQTGSSSVHDAYNGTMRSEARVHLIRCDKTTAELRDLDIAQQNPNAQRKGELFSIAMEAVKNYFKPLPGQKVYASVLILDSHWDKEAKILTGHAALGGGSGEVQLAIFGSHALHSYPTCVEEVVPAFSDCTPTDTEFVANDCNEAGSSWEAACIGIGAQMHEVGHLFGCPHQASGVMLRDYVTLNRSFTVREPYSTRTKSPGGLVLKKDECSWHRLDILRFRNHPCFRLQSDPPMHPDIAVQAWPVDDGKVLITAKSGIAFVEIYCDDEDLCYNHMQYGDGTPEKPYPKQICLTEAEIRVRLLEDKKKSKKLKLQIKSAGGGQFEINDFCHLISKDLSIKLPNEKTAFRSTKIGFSQLEGSEAQEMILDSSLHERKLLTHVKIYHGFALDGIEFVYEDFETQLFGKRGGKPGGSTFNLDTRKAEQIIGFHVRGGAWIDGIQIVTTRGRKSEFYGNATGGSAHTLIPPPNYKFCGISGTCGQWIDGFSLLITR